MACKLKMACFQGVVVETMARWWKWSEWPSDSSIYK